MGAVIMKLADSLLLLILFYRGDEVEAGQSRSLGKINEGGR